MVEITPHCLYCNRSSDQIPLLNMEYQNKEYWICPQHLPILIHEPGKLSSQLPGIEILPGAEHHHHD
jgi:hypothetical protein